MKTELIILLQTCPLISCVASTSENHRIDPGNPNIVLILTDDQGIGDVGFNGNPYIKTPYLDKLASNSTRLTEFYVSPVCAPTRASLMTGRFYQRTGVYDTYNGGAIMATEETTIAEILKQNHYKTGIFGKWHLGDGYPFRPVDQGFDESLIHKGGGIGQPGDVANYFAFDSAYFNPVLLRNGKPVKSSGYCSDVFTDGAIDFIQKNNNRPFFLYLAFNAPHNPLQLPDKYYRIYEKMNFNPDSFRLHGENFPNMTKKEIEDARRVYGMVTNIDDNVGRLMQTLKENNLAENTMVIFLTDNGPQQNRYRMGLRGKKGSVYDGGIKVPCLIHFPAVFPVNKEIAVPLASIDLLPTILDACGIHLPSGRNIDGKSILPLLKNDDPVFYNRLLFWEWNRGFPIPWQNFAVRKGNYKLVGNTDYNSSIEKFELYNLSADPYESFNIVNEQIKMARELKDEMTNWYYSIINGENYRKIPRIIVGSEFENPVELNRNDAKGSPGIWDQEEIYGYWDVSVARTGNYRVKVQFLKPLSANGRLFLKLYPHQFSVFNTVSSVSTVELHDLFLTAGDYRLEIYYESTENRIIFPLCAEFFKTNKN